MLLIALKLVLGFFMVGVGLWFWRLATRWNDKGEIPKEWVEAKEPRPWTRADHGFKSFVAWQRLMACLFWLFAGLLAVSIVLQLAGVEIE